MRNTFKYVISAAVVLATSVSSAFAGGSSIPLGAPLGNELSSVLGTTLPFGDAGILSLAAAGVIGGVWLARRKR